MPIIHPGRPPDRFIRFGRPWPRAAAAGGDLGRAGRSPREQLGWTGRQAVPPSSRLGASAAFPPRAALGSGGSAAVPAICYLLLLLFVPWIPDRGRPEERHRTPVRSGPEPARQVSTTTAPWRRLPRGPRRQFDVRRRFPSARRRAKGTGRHAARGRPGHQMVRARHGRQPVHVGDRVEDRFVPSPAAGPPAGRPRHRRMT